MNSKFLRRMLALVALLGAWGCAQALPLKYTFDLGAAGSGSFSIKSNATAPLVDRSELSAFDWHIAGVGGFDLTDLSVFSFGRWSSLNGLQPNANGLLSLGFVLKTNTRSDTGVACAICIVAAQVAPPGVKNSLAAARVVVRATGSPCGSRGACRALTPHLGVVAEPASWSLSALALTLGPWLRRRRQPRPAHA